CAAAGVATTRVLAKYTARMTKQRRRAFMVSPVQQATFSTLITILGIWSLISEKMDIVFGGPEGI
ncbi:MAG: hypothetical protein VXV76_02955, partial [Candidatus Thermoplasmatota archaeon]|nr:hypothetical protein [Candidatus Thermoplasmatota archaeon]